MEKDKYNKIIHCYEENNYGAIKVYRIYYI